MKEIKIAKEILLKLVNNEISFSNAIKNAFHKYNPDQIQKGNITALVGCELRHHYIFDNLISRFFDEIEFEKTVLLRFELANRLFLKRFDDKELFSLVEEELDKDKIQSLIDYVDSSDAIIPRELDRSSPEFLSLRYNTPAWVIRMWQKQYGKGVVFKTLKVNYRQSTSTLRVGKNLDINKFLAAHPDFSKSPVEDIIVYQGRGSVKNLPEFKNNDIFFMKMATKEILDKLDLDPLKGIAVFSEVPNNIHFEVLNDFGNDVSLELIINHPNFYYEVRRYVKEKGLPHIYVYESAETGLITCLSKKVHTFICMPKSTAFDLFRSTPDYFLRIKQDQLDEIIAHETNALNESAEFVEEGGELVYMIPTLSRKESNNLIAKFIVSHPEFSLVEEKQYFPFDSYDSCLYYARLKKAEALSD